MVRHPSCRACQHCTAPRGVTAGWCGLRQLPIHPELASELWCHHWTPRPPRLPVSPAAGLQGPLSAAAPSCPHRQLSLDVTLPPRL